MFLGLDLGTSGVKAVVVDEDGKAVAQGLAPLTASSPYTGWSEQDPSAWWHAACDAVLAIDPEFRRAVRAIGLSGQMHGATLIDENHRVLRPAILWNDGRSAAMCAQIEREVPESRAITGNIAMPGFTAPKIAWVREHEPDVFAQIHKVLLPKDYLRLCMTGAMASDMSDSSGTLWLDVAKRAWSDEMLAATGLTRKNMPDLFEGTEQSGVLLADVASAWGMDRVPVAGGGGDNAAGAVGIGVVEDGDALLSLGTSGVTFVATRDFRPNPDGAVHAFCHCLPDQWHQMAVHLSAASCLDWAARLLNIGGPAELIALAETVTPGAGPELFLPFLNGERTPHNNERLRAGWIGCDGSTTPARLASAVLEGIAFAHADGLAALRNAGTTVDRMTVIGGGSRSTHWGRILATSLDVTLDYLQDGELGPSMGASRLARMCVTGESPATVCTRPALHTTIEPDESLHTALGQKLWEYRRIVGVMDTF